MAHTAQDIQMGLRSYNPSMPSKLACLHSSRQQAMALLNPLPLAYLLIKPCQSILDREKYVLLLHLLCILKQLGLLLPCHDMHSISTGLCGCRRAYAWGLKGPYLRFTPTSMGDYFQYAKNTWCRAKLGQINQLFRRLKFWKRR